MLDIYGNLRVWTVMFVLAIGSGCTSVADLSTELAGLGVITEDVSTFDNKRTIDVSPNWLYDPNGGWGNSVKLGARWNEKYPDTIALTMSYTNSVMSASEAYLLINGVDIAVNGESFSFSTDSPTDHDSSGYNTVSRDIYTESRNMVLIPITLFETMLSASDTRLRIFTSEGYEDSVLTIERMPGGGATAINSLRKFLLKVKTATGTGQPLATAPTEQNHTSPPGIPSNLLDASFRFDTIGWLSFGGAGRAAAGYATTEKLLTSRQWEKLALHVKQVNFGDDLHNYLLALSLYEMGYHRQALVYIKQSIIESERPLRGKCISCLGFSFPGAAVALERRIKAALNTPN
jgi:hypothetical protein